MTTKLEKTTKTTKTKKATTKNTTPKKSEDQALAMTPEMIAQFQAFLQMQQQELAEKPKKQVSVKTKVTKSDLRKNYKDDFVFLSNCTSGIVGYDSKITGQSYVWESFGSIVEMPMTELLAMPDKYIKSPWVMFSDDNDMLEDLIKAYGVEDLYKHINTLEDIEYDIENIEVDLIKDIVDSLNTDGNILIDDIANKVQNAIENGVIDSHSKIKQLSKILGKDFFLPEE
nr:MAG TPA: hypothetical protein [Caudoviricetes sp.]